MDVNELLQKLYDILPEVLDDDKFLKEFWDTLIESCTEKSFFIGRISLSLDLFQKLDDNLKKDKNFLIREDDVLMRFMIFGTTTILFTIKYQSNVYHIEEQIDIERKKDMIFAAQFAIPFSMARFFRKNFNKYKKQLSANLASYLMEQDNKAYSLKDYFWFSEPFSLDSLEDYIMQFKNQELLELLKDVNLDEEIEFSNESYGDISFIKNNLLKGIGSGLVVMSRILINNLYALLEGKVEITGLVSTGYVLKKENGVFTLYQITIKNGVISMICEEISDVTSLFNINAKNENVKGLTEFFFDELGLK